MAMTKQFTKTQWNNDREPAITAEQLNRMEKGIDDNDTRIVALDKAVTANKTAGDKILAEVNKTLQEHTEDIAAVNTELTSQGKAIGELADKKITKFYASSQGESTLSDSDDGKMQDMMLYGKSEQKQYSGKQQFNINNVVSSKINGLTISSIVENNLTIGISIVGTLSGDSAYLLVRSKSDDFTLEKGKSYKLTGGAPGVNIRVREFGGDGTEIASHVDIGNGVTFTVSEDTSACDMYIIVYGTNGQNKNLEVYPMVTLSTETNDSYEPYVGCIPSPNPDYPQEIKSVVEPVVKVTGKNLLNATLQTKTVEGVTCTANGDGTYTLNGTATNTITFRVRTDIPADGKTYRIVGCPKAMSLSTAYIDFSNNVNNARKDTGNGATILLTGEYTYVVTIVVINGYTCKNLVFKPMIVDADKHPSVTYDDFESYHEQSVTLTGITLNAILVSSGGNVTIDGQQYISDYVDVERGKIIRKVREMILNGSENWSVEADGKTESHRMFTNVSKNYATIVHLPSSIIGAICSHFIETSSYDTWNATQKNAFSFSANNTSLHVRKKGILTVDELKSWLSKNNITIYYPLATPTEESLSDELAEKLKALQTYYPQTNLFITSNQLDGYAIFNYPISLANGWNYVKQQIGDTRDYIYDMDLQMAQAYVNSEYAVALTELEV